MTRFNLLMLAMFALMAAGITPVEVARAAGGDDEAVREANEQFYSALNQMFKGEIAPMEALWSHAEDVTYLGPDGKFVVGWEAVSTDWKEQAAMTLGGSVRPENLQAKAGADLAIVQCRELGENIVDGKPAQVSLRATNVYRKEGGQWKMVSHHTDKLPYLEE